MIRRVFFASRIKRPLMPGPKPFNKCWVMVARKFDCNCGLYALNMLLDVVRLLLKPTCSAVPVMKPWLKVKLYWSRF